MKTIIARLHLPVLAWLCLAPCAVIQTDFSTRPENVMAWLAQANGHGEENP